MVRKDVLLQISSIYFGMQSLMLAIMICLVIGCALRPNNYLKAYEGENLGHSKTAVIEILSKDHFCAVSLNKMIQDVIRNKGNSLLYVEVPSGSYDMTLIYDSTKAIDTRSYLTETAVNKSKYYLEPGMIYTCDAVRNGDRVNFNLRKVDAAESYILLNFGAGIFVDKLISTNPVIWKQISILTSPDPALKSFPEEEGYKRRVPIQFLQDYSKP